MLSYRPIGVACHPLIARNGRDRRRLLGSAAQLPDEFSLGARRGALPGLHYLRLTVTMAYYFRSMLLAQTDQLLRCPSF